MDQFPLKFPLNGRRGSRVGRRAFGVIMDVKVTVSGTETNLCNRLNLDSPAVSQNVIFGHQHLIEGAVNKCVTCI